MAQKTIVELIDDFDGSEATTTIQFGLHGKAYEIDLNDEHAAEFEEAFAPYLRAGRALTSSGKRSTRTPTSGAAASGVDPSAVRRWAEAQGIEVSPRGRIKKEIVDQFLAAGN